MFEYQSSLIDGVESVFYSYFGFAFCKPACSGVCALRWILIRVVEVILYSSFDQLPALVLRLLMKWSPSNRSLNLEGKSLYRSMCSRVLRSRFILRMRFERKLVKLYGW